MNISHTSCKQEGSLIAGKFRTIEIVLVLLGGTQTSIKVMWDKVLGIKKGAKWINQPKHINVDDLHLWKEGGGIG